MTGNSLEKDIDKEFSGDIKIGLTTIVKVAMNRPKYFAEQLHKSMAGLGTDDESLIRVSMKFKFIYLIFKKIRGNSWLSHAQKLIWGTLRKNLKKTTINL